MADGQTQAADPIAQEPQGTTAQVTDWKAEARKWEARAKENKAKADAYDEAQEAAKSDLQKALEERDRWKADYAALKESNDRRDAIDSAAAEYGVDAAMLARMAGDVEDNARFLKQQADAAPKYPSVYDGGQQTAKVAQTTAQQFADAIDFL